MTVAGEFRLATPEKVAAPTAGGGVGAGRRSNEERVALRRAAPRTKDPAMKPLDTLTAAFELLWETKVYLTRTTEGLDADFAARVREVHRQVAVTRDQVQHLLIELQAKLPPAAPRPPA